MLEFIAVNMAPIMFASLVVFLLLGYSVAFSLAANGLLFFAIGVWLAPYSQHTITLDWALLGTMPQRLWGTMSNETMLAIPFFTFMGIILERSGMAEDLLDTVGQLFGPVRGGLAYAVIIVGALLAATTGVVAASVIAMGLISLPIMMRFGYDRRVASGVIAASGTLAQIIPPSLVLIVLADQLGKSVGDMYKGALIPGLVLTGFYMAYVFTISILRPHWVPALPPEARTLGHGVLSLLVAVALAIAIGYGAHLWLYPTQGANADILGGSVGVIAIYLWALADKALGMNLLSNLARQVIIVLIPPLALIFLVLGTIFLGIATPTEGGAMGAVGAMVLAAMKGRLTMPVITQALASTTRLSAFVMFILVGARMFSLAFYGVNGQIWVEHLLVGLPGGQTGFLIFVSVLVFLLAFFLDFFELAFIIVPLLVAPATALGIDLIWFGVILGVNMQTSFMHPPFGFALFYLRSVAPRGAYTDKVTGKRLDGVTTGQIYWGAVPFVVIQVVMIGVVIAFPSLVMHYQGVIVDPSTIEIKVPTLQPMAPLGGATTAPAPGGLPGLPTLGQPTVTP
ncbi:TRAP transporter large permease subunit [Rhodobacter sp. SGA-6-6]|uniref:TRAP transporter large permease n=1 Tax=Rhodobacter sp. SGA-6-6 TaxID=2710882 RepID=UPI0013ED6539|nr:TRAP transporter large permease subunit [Rhodobacter sp. SGA-6-6]NGM46685.1 TRAP transporter large permease subunit [Rhodobacter sp. SGA-6-6]